MPKSRLAVLADATGRVIAAHLINELPAERGAGIKADMGPRPGQTRHEVDVPSELGEAKPEDLLRSIHVGYYIKSGALTRKKS